MMEEQVDLMEQMKADIMKRKKEEHIEELEKKALTILKLISDEYFAKRYRTDHKGFPEVYILSSINNETHLHVEIEACCPVNQADYRETDKFRSNPEFEEVIFTYTHSKEKPNPHLARNRNWDVAVILFMKIEWATIEELQTPKNLTLKREAEVLHFLWDSFAKDQSPFDEMTGIPMIFDYHEVDCKYCKVQSDTGLSEYDMYGSLISGKYSKDADIPIRYMTVEKLGPSVDYLLELRGSVKGHRRTLSFNTAFKIFDQLVCRLLQIHRYNIIHGDLDPSKLHFGHASCMNVLYLGNFSCATALKPGRQISRPIAGSIRFAALSATKGAHRHPNQDIESAFYVLLAMLMPNLPWDSSFSHQKVSSETGNLSKSSGSVLIDNSSVDTSIYDRRSRRNSALHMIANKEDSRFKDVVLDHSQIREMKASLWKPGSDMIKKVVSHIEYQSSFPKDENSPAVISLAADIIFELHARILELINSPINGADNAALNCKNLKKQTSAEFQFYMDLRRSVLLFFHCDDFMPLIGNQTFRKKLSLRNPEALSCWDLSTWCFMKLDMMHYTRSKIPPGSNSSRVLSATDTAKFGLVDTAN